MGGNVPLGYIVKDRKLIVNEPRTLVALDEVAGLGVDNCCFSRLPVSLFSMWNAMRSLSVAAE